VTALLLAARQAGSRASTSLPIPPHEPRLEHPERLRPVAFEPGPAGAHGGFLARTGRYDVTVGADRAVFHLRPVAATPASTSRAAHGPSDSPADVSATPPNAIAMTLVGAQARTAIEPASPLPGKVNYLLGDDPAEWRRNVPTYARVLTHAPWPGIDVAYYGNAGSVETDFVVAPGGDAQRIALDFTGADDVRVDGDGALALTASDGQILRLLPPTAYQVQGSARTSVSARYALDARPAADGARRVHFDIGAYDRTKALVIDPLALAMVYSTYFNPGTFNDYGQAVAVDEHGHAFVAGNSSFPPDEDGFPVPIYGFVMKVSGDGRSVLWTTYISHGASHSRHHVWDGSYDGRSNLTGVTALALDGEHAVITGWTNAGLPHTPGAYHNPLIGGGLNQYVYVAKLTDDGDDVVYTAMPIVNGQGLGVAVDHAGRAFVVGYTEDDWTLPVTPDALIPAMPTYHSGFLVELSADGSTILYATYLGSGEPDKENHRTYGETYARGVAVDSSGAVYVAGETEARHFITKNAFQPDTNDSNACPLSDFGGEGFVMKFDTRHRLAYSSYLGGACNDSANAIAVGGDGTAYVTGSTEGIGFPCLQSAFPCEPHAVPAVFVTKVNSDGNGLVYSTILGYGEGASIATRHGHAYLTGWTSDPRFPTRRAVQPVIGGGGTADAFVAELRGDGFNVVFSTFLGGSGYDEGTGLALGVHDGIYVVGLTVSKNFPTHRAQLHNPDGVRNGFLTKFIVESVEFQRP
jgi:hypothetical protein